MAGKLVEGEHPPHWLDVMTTAHRVGSSVKTVMRRIERNEYRGGLFRSPNGLKWYLDPDSIWPAVQKSKDSSEPQTGTVEGHYRMEDGVVSAVLILRPFTGKSAQSAVRNRSLTVTPQEVSVTVSAPLSRTSESAPWTDEDTNDVARIGRH